MRTLKQELDYISGKFATGFITIFGFGFFWFLLFESLICLTMNISTSAAYTVKGYTALTVVLSLPFFIGTLGYIGFKKIEY